MGQPAALVPAAACSLVLRLDSQTTGGYSHKKQLLFLTGDAHAAGALSMPLPAASVSVDETTHDSVTLTWGAGLTASTLEPVSHFELQWREASSEAWEDTPGSRRIRSMRCVKRNMPGGSVFYYRVRAIGHDGTQGRWSAPSEPVATKSEANGRSAAVEGAIPQQLRPTSKTREPNFRVARGGTTRGEMTAPRVQATSEPVPGSVLIEWEPVDGVVSW